MNITYAGSRRDAELQRIVDNQAYIYIEPAGIVRVDKCRLIGVDDEKDNANARSVNNKLCDNG